jgi:hypothetical protein
VRVLPCTIAMIATAAVAVHARADGTGVIAASIGDRAALAAAVTDAIGDRARRIVPDAVAEARGALASGAVPTDELARFRRVRDLVDEGWRAYLRVAVEVAAQRLASARNEAEPLLALPGGAEVYADAALRLGAVLGHLGRRDESRAVLRLALALDPERPITLAEFSPDVLELVEAARAERPEHRQLEIVTSPPGASVRIDGIEVGRAPLVVDVPRGQHVLVTRLGDHTAAVRGVAVDGAARVEIELVPERAARRLGAGASLGLGDAAQQELIDAVVEYADLDEVVVVAETTRRGGPTLLAQRCVGVPARCSAVVEIGFPAGGLAAAARVAWDAVRAGELRYPPSVLGEHGRRVPPPRWCEACRSPWLWTGVGASIVAGAVIALVVTSSSRPPPIVGIDPGDFVGR